MAFEVVIKPIAFLEIDDAVLYYEKQVTGLSRQFLSAVDDCVNKISKQPNHYLIISSPVRRILLNKFPYKLLYFISDNQEVVIIALIHNKRSNRYIKNRIVL